MHAELVFLSGMRREAVEAECAAVFDKLDVVWALGSPSVSRVRKNFSPRSIRDEISSG